MNKQRAVFVLCLMVGLAVVAAGLASLLQPAESSSLRHITVSDDKLPFETSLILAKGEAARLTLPNGKDIAFWCRAGDVLNNSSLALTWGEKAFKQPELTRRKMPNGREATEWNSYIRQGSVATSVSTPATARQLFVDKYRVVLKDAGETNGSLPVTVQVCLATNREMLSGEAKREYYLNLLKSDKPEERIEGIRELQQKVTLGWTYTGDPGKIADAIRPLMKDSDARVKAAAEAAMPALGDEQALLALITPEPQGRWRTVDGATTLAFWYRLNKPKAMITQSLTFFDSKDDSLVLFATAFFATVHDPIAKPHLLAALNNPSPATRAQAVGALRFVCTHEETAQQMLPLLKDPSKEVLLVVLREANWVNDRIPPREIMSLLTHADPEVRQRAAYALEGLRDPEVVEALLAATRDMDARVRAEAAVTLGRAHTPKAYSRLLEMFADDNPNVRLEAVNGLRWLRDTRAIVQIQKLLENEKDQNVRMMADRTIRELRL